MQKVIIILSQFRAEGNAPQQLSLPLASVPQAELFSHKLQIPSLPGIPPVIPCDRRLTDCLQSLEEQGFSGDSAIFILTLVGAEI